MTAEHILVVDDEAIARENISWILEEEGYIPTVVESAEKAVEILSDNDYALVITDLMLPGMSGLELLEKVRTSLPTAEVIVITGHATVNTAVKAMQKGAHSYIAKPFDIDELKTQVVKALEQRALSVEVLRLRKLIAQGRQDLPLVGESTPMRNLKKKIAQVAQMNCNVLIQGETGTGKELVARSIHMLSPRSSERFMAINCGTFTAELMDKELFGHEREAFTGASRGQKGILEVADGGTIFFDEIGELPLNMQVKLLRVLQERNFLRVGGTKEIPVDIKVVAATNCNLADEVEAGRFRQDLFYRLNVVTLNVPPLKTLKEDIPVLVGHFLEQYRTKEFSINSISQETLDILMNYSFPGNVRELENIVQRALALAGGTEFTPDLLPSEVYKSAGQTPLRTLEEVEKEHIGKILSAMRGNKTKSANILGIDRVSLWRKLKKYNME